MQSIQCPGDSRGTDDFHITQQMQRIVILSEIAGQSQSAPSDLQEEVFFASYHMQPQGFL